jgi:CubicO group peptidase (beta-lactamase class C family)
MKSQTRTAAAIAMMTVVFAAVPTARQAATWKTVDGVFAEWNRPDSPGCALGVYKNGAMAYERGYGMADLEHDVPNAPDTVFYVGSLSKQFTAFAAALAIEQGSLSARDSIRKFLPELPAYADAITVSHLIHHTSGLRDYNTLLSIAGRRGDEAYDNATVLRITARQKKLNFTPGDEYLYSNTGYTLLATIVERATRTPFAAFADARIFRPLGMADSHFHTDGGRIVKRRALGFARGGDGWRLETPSNERAGAGGLYTSVRDLLRWDQNFYAPKAGGDALVRQVQARGTLNDGSVLPYAWGLQIGNYRGEPIVEHSGALGGYRAHLLRVPEQRVTVAALCNAATISPGALVRLVADAVIGSGFTRPRTAASAGVSLDAARVEGQPAAMPGRPADYAGAYYSDEIDATFTVSASGDAIVLRRDSDAEAAPAQAWSGGVFRFRGMTLRFERGPDGRATALLVDAGRVRDIRFLRTTDNGS